MLSHDSTHSDTICLRLRPRGLVSIWGSRSESVQVTALVMLTLGVASTAEKATATAMASSSATDGALSDQAAATSSHHDAPQPQPEPNYHYRYAVASRKTGDVKGAWEKRAGEDVWGAYFLRDPDGRWRTVHYEADGTGFYATVQRRPLYRRGKLVQQQGELHGNTALPLDDATWKSVLAAAKHSAREDNHPALQKAKVAGGMEGAASVSSYSTTRAPGYGYSSPAASVTSYSTTRAPGYGFSSPAASVTSYSTTRAPGFGFSRPATSVTSYSTTRAPSFDFGFSSPAASSYSTTKAPGFGFARSPNFAKQPLRPPREQSTLGASAFSASYRSQPLRANRTPPSYSSAYASQPLQQQEQVEEDADETTTITPSADSYSNQEEADESQQAPAQTSEDADGDAEQFAEPHGPASSEPYRASASDDVQQHQEDESSNEAAQDDDEEDDVKHRDEESDDGEHNPDDDHEIVPEQARQGSQVRHDHEALQVAPESRLPLLHVHHLQESQQLQSPQVREPGLADTSMDHLLGPAWGIVSSHSSLFEGQDFPLFGGQDLRSEETPQDTQDSPTWTQRERADRSKGRRAAAQGSQSPVQSDAAQGRQRGAGSERGERGAGRFSGSLRAGAAFGSSDRLRGSADPSDKDAAAPSTEATWSFGSKVRGKEDPTYQQAPASPSKRGKNQNRGPVLFAQHAQQVEASTPAGDRRLPPRGYAAYALQEDKVAWQHSRARPVSYSGWVPVTASLQAADSYRDPSPGRLILRK
ncbi:uncharacterized protein LOC117643594 [Thrips palmi]|uniref:Uncharacterized protein LOC117643594 n=1 Tax=Thrips palmi TaxID=161013 RepID=A0A6P8YNQ9_THRPL|nr:uncharacterized protein LOC117643594 [Thrips palmi]